MLLLSLLLELTYFNFIISSKLKLHSFEPPFKDVDGVGDRIVSPNWRSSGHTVVHTNFVRLTPDRQSKRGAIWSTKPLGVDSWSGLLTFRISGQGKTLFGDGIALWITHQSYYNPGDLHGSQEKYTGVGIIFDTFRNTENAGTHKDITILINDGQKTYEEMAKTSIGCDASIRYYAERADFDVTKSVRAKILIEPERIGIAIDVKGNGEYTDCAVLDNPPGLSFDWLKKAHIGITATTGALADNHDVISLQSFSDFEVMEQTDNANSVKKYFEPAPKSDKPGRIKKIEKAINDLMAKNKIREHHIEHAFAAIDDHLSNMVQKLEKREDKSDVRIQELEEKIKKTVAGTIDTRVSRLEWQLTSKVQKTVAGYEEDIVKQMETTIQETTKNSNNSWMIPFYILVGLLIIGVIGLVVMYRKLVAHHLL